MSRSNADSTSSDSTQAADTAGDKREKSGPSWYSHFGLSGDPFRHDSGEFYYGARYGVASLRLEQALGRQRGFIVVVGAAGTGKSTLIESVLTRVDLSAVATVSAAESAPTSVIDVLLRSREPGAGQYGSTRKRAALLSLIESASTSGRPIVCVIEDAHRASVGQLKDLFETVNITPDAHMVLQVVLVGRPKLRKTLEAAALSALTSRITTRVDTTSLTPREVADYLTDRLELVGGGAVDAILPMATITAIAHYSRGVIDLINALTRVAMQRAAESGSGSVTTEHVDDAAELCVKILGETRALPVFASPRIWIAGAATAGFIGLALLVSGAQVNMIGSSDAPIEAAVGSLPNVAATPAAAAEDRSFEIAQRRSPREEFLSGTPYEVEIKPPPRPAETVPESQPEPSIEMLMEEVELPPAPGPPRPPQGLAPANQPNRPPVAQQGPPPGWPAPMPPQQAPAPMPVPQMAEQAAPAGPYVSLQVGAFREMRSAAAMKRKLATMFPDVYVSTIHSGGEPLHRVRVGRFNTPEETLPLKQRLQSAGYPSFRVTEP